MNPFLAGMRVGLAILASAWVVTAQAQPAAPPPRFAILEFAVEGNTVLPTESVERAVYPFMGEERTIDDVEAARAALEKAYRSAGFATVGVDIPEQRVTGGLITLRVVQAEVSRLRVTGARYYSQDRILAQVPSLAPGQVPNLPLAQEQLGNVNRSADRVVQPLLRPGKTPGTTEVDLAVEDHLPLHGSLELNNRAAPNTSATRLSGSVRYDNLFQREHSLGLQAQISPEKPKEVAVYSASYSVPLGLDQISFSLVHSDSTVAAGVGDTTVFGKGNIWGLRRSLVIALRDKEYHVLNLGVDFKDFRELVATGDSGITTPVHYLPLSASYLGIMEDTAGRWQGGVGVVAAARGLASHDAQFADKRYNATSAFSVLKFDLAREQKLGMAGLTLFAKIDGQLTGAPLISNEQFVAGGVDSVRGYFESQAVGDNAWHGTLELRSANLGDKAWPWVSSMTALGFVDGASLQIIDPLPGQSTRFRLLSAGVGLAVKGKPYGTLTLNLGVPLKTVGTVDRGTVRLHAAGSFEF
jgi:hemolysin activation/secretion protein